MRLHAPIALVFSLALMPLATTTAPTVTVVDAYTALGQSGTPTALNTNWDDVSGGPDGLHIDTEGHSALSTLILATPGAL